MILAAVALSLATVEPVPETWLDAVAHVETGGERNPDAALGDGKKARGRFQFHKEAWADCSKVRKKAGLPVHPYAKASDPVVSREYARTWLTYLRGVLLERIGRTPFPGEVWLAFNLGLEGFAGYGYQWAMVPACTFDKARTVNSLAWQNKRTSR